MKVILTIIILFILTNAFGQNIKIIKNTIGSDSIVQMFYENGKLFYQVPYRNGKQNGWYEQYYENGSVWSKDFRVDGKTIDGNYISLFDNGKINQEGAYKNGHQVGKWISYSNDGKPFKIYIYNKKGELIKLEIWNETKKQWEKTGLY